MAELFLIKTEVKFIMMTNIKNILYIIIGLYIILTPFFYKIIVLRLPKNIEELNIIFAICSSLIFLILFLNIIININRRKNENFFILYLKEIIIKPLQKMYFNSLLIIDKYIKHELLGPKYVGQPLLKITYVINNHLNDLNSIRYFIFFVVCPKIIIIICLFIDVIINKHLKYIYIFGAITLIPLIINYFIYTLKEFAIANMKGLTQNCIVLVNENHLEIAFENILKNYITSYFESNQHIEFIRAITLKETLQENEDFDETLDFYLKQFHVFTNLYTSMTFFYYIKLQKYYRIFLALYYFCFSCIWLYIIYNIII